MIRNRMGGSSPGSVADANGIAELVGGIADDQVGGLEDLAQLDLAVDERDAGGPLDGLLARSDLDQPEASDQLFGLGERALDHRRPAMGEADARAARGRVEAL